VARQALPHASPAERPVADGAGHWPQREAAELFTRRLLAFLAGLA
jgi:pimeloyl-ACP methyl ester carboxylesterase